MTADPNIIFVKNDAESRLEAFTEQARATKDGAPWRCLYASLSAEITKDPTKRNIATAFLTASFEHTYDARAFWLETGHLFIFFQGPVRAVIKDYEGFLDRLMEKDEQIKYHFFWELNKFWGYFDEVLSSALKDISSPKVEGAEQREAEGMKASFQLDPDLCRQRQSRYRPLLLIVEDDRVTRHMLQTIMEKYCDIAVAWNAGQAQEFYQTMLPNITFLDIELPDGDGRELAELFCREDHDAFVVMVSGALSPQAIQRCMKAGVKGAVRKPATEKQLLTFIDQYNSVKQNRSALG